MQWSRLIRLFLSTHKKNVCPCPLGLLTLISVFKEVDEDGILCIIYDDLHWHGNWINPESNFIFN